MSPEHLLKLGRHQEAERRARGILDRDPEHIGALETLAKVQWHLGKFEALVPTLDRLLALNPYEPGYHALRGATHQAQGQCGKAVVDYSRCAEGDTPEAETARENIADIQEWERFLVSDLLERDPVFCADYFHDPKEACRKRGFEFVEDLAASEPWVPATPAVVLWARPS